MKRLVSLALLAGAVTFGCGDDDGGPADAAPPADGSAVDAPSTPDAPQADAAPPSVLPRSSKSSTVAVTTDDAIVIMVNPEDDSISIFETAGDTRVIKLATGDEPSAVVIHPDNKTAFVAHRGESTVVKINDIDTASPTVDGAVADVGSEPTGLALSPTGARLFVAEWAEGRITVLNTADMSVNGTIDAPANPRGIAVTNDGDIDDDDELLVVPEFFGEPGPGAEGANDSRTGRVRIYSLLDYSPQTPILLPPRLSGFTDLGGLPTMASPNQLWGVAIQGQKIYVPSISVSPAPPVRNDLNVYPFLYVGNLADSTEDQSNVGSVNLAKEVVDEIPTGTRFFLADIVDLSFLSAADVAYVVSRGADVVQRVVFDPATGVTIGSLANKQIDLNVAGMACQNPTGIVVAHGAPRAYVNCWTTRNLGVVDLAAQALEKVVLSSDPPTAGSPESSQNRGRRFYFTGRGRWSSNAWSTCGSCHPDGLTDNMTWIFPAGPRQTTSMDGTFSHGPGMQKQRILNWTGIFDEMHDFERNTRGVSGGLGALTTAPAGGCGVMETAQSLTGIGGLQQPLRELQSTPLNCTTDWDDINEFAKVIRPPRALRVPAPADVTAGQTLFLTGGCNKCHGGAGWTASRLFWTPTSADNSTLTTTALVKPSGWLVPWNNHVNQIEVQQIQTNEATTIAPPQVSCVIRDIDTFGIPGDLTGTDTLEVRENPVAPGGLRAQGAGGYNIPSLYGLAVGAPYLHHGQASSLTELFDDPKWLTHMQAGNLVFLPTAMEKQQLIAFLLSIDATTPEITLAANQDGCPAVFP